MKHEFEKRDVFVEITYGREGNTLNDMKRKVNNEVMRDVQS